MSRVIGIDLGTTNCCVSVMENSEPIIIPSSNGHRTTPSVVAFTKNGERLIGESAKRQEVTNPERTISSIKRHMGKTWSKNIDGKSYNPQIISSMILAQLKKDAEDFLGETVTDAVITVPAYFNDIQRQATKDAGRIAGLNIKRIINEPTSAALSYGLNHGHSQKVMVYDLGGGTFDVSIIEIADDVIEVIATSGDNNLGGDDFDDRITNWIINEFQKENKINLSNDFMALNRIKEAAENAKKELSSTESTTIELPYIYQGGGEPKHLRLTLTRSVFAGLIADLVKRTELPVKNALNDAGIAASELSSVLLVGGSTRIPMVQEKVRSLIGKEPSKNINPDECVAKGAAILGGTLQDTGTSMVTTQQSILLLDVIPLTLSIETIGGVATPLVQRNTTLPTKYSQIFTTAASFQRDVEIHVLQGERPMAKDNRTIGKFKLKGIKRAPAGVPQIEVTFDLDVNGILKVSAKDLDTNKEQSITITADDRMSDAEIEQAMRDASSYADDDKLRRDAMELINESQQLLAKVQLVLKEQKKEMDKNKRKDLKKQCDNLQKLLSKCHVEKVNADEVEAIHSAKQELEHLSGINM